MLYIELLGLVPIGLRRTSDQCAKYVVGTVMSTADAVAFIVSDKHFQC